MENQDINKIKLKHKEWRRLAKKLRRKKIRQNLAKDRDKKLEEEENEKLKNPTYQNWLKEQENLKLFRIQNEQQQHEIDEENWMRRELLDQKRFRDEKKRQEAIEAINEAQRLQIQKDFDKLQKAAQQKRDQKKQQIEEIEQQHKLLMNKIQDYINGISELPIELTITANSNPGKDMCQFFVKTGACRYGDKCERNHSRPGLSKIILIRNFFTHIQFEHSCNTEYGNDISLEFSYADVYNDFEIFYNDVIPEMQEFGKIINFKVCSNSLSHLRGNVYVEFETNRDALNAYMKLQGRYYAGKRLNVEFCTLISWKTAVCGENFLRKCPKGRSCNFLHIFKNPENKYNNFYSNFNKTNDKKKDANTISTWDHIDGETTNERRNWRWSESPERLDTKSIRSSSIKSKRHISKSPSRRKRKTSRSRDSERTSSSRNSDRTTRHSDIRTRHSDIRTRCSDNKLRHSDRSNRHSDKSSRGTDKSSKNSNSNCSEQSSQSHKTTTRREKSPSSRDELGKKKKKKKKDKIRKKSKEKKERK